MFVDSKQSPSLDSNLSPSLVIIKFDTFLTIIFVFWIQKTFKICWWARKSIVFYLFTKFLICLYGYVWPMNLPILSITFFSMIISDCELHIPILSIPVCSYHQEIWSTNSIIKFRVIHQGNQGRLNWWQCLLTLNPHAYYYLAYCIIAVNALNSQWWVSQSLFFQR